MNALRIVFAGTPEFALPALEALARSEHRIAGVLTQPDRPAGRGRALRASAVKQRALQLGLPVAQPAQLKRDEDLTPLKEWQPELLVVVAYGLLLPPSVLALPRLGCLNIHASLLPRWRGAAPIQRAILAGDAATGVTIMQMDSGLDTGAMLAQRKVAIGPEMSSAELQSVLAPLGAELLIEVIGALLSGNAKATPQPATGVSYASKLDKRDALIDWQDSAAQIARQVRGCNPWPVAHTLMHGEPLKIWQAQPLPSASEGPKPPGSVLGLRADRVQVQCGEGSLAIERLQCAGKRAVTAKDFAHGHALAGLRFG